MNYKENQRVKLRDDLQVGKRYGDWTFTKEGVDFIGEIVTLGEWTNYKNKQSKTFHVDKTNNPKHKQAKGYFISNEPNSTFIISTDMIDHEGSKYILNDEDGLTDKLKKVTKQNDPFAELIHMANNNPEPTVSKIIEHMDNDENIKPAHYRKNIDDLFEAAYRTRPFEEFRAIMEFVAERYLRRLKGSPEKRLEDLEKALYTIKRLKEKEIIELEKRYQREEEVKQWFNTEKTNLHNLNDNYFNITDDSFRLYVFEHVYKDNELHKNKINLEIYHDIARITVQQHIN